MRRETSLRVKTLCVTLGLALMASAGAASAADEHWSRQFPAPKKSTEMVAGSGMSDGTGKPTVSRVQWHKGKLYMAGAWEPGVSGEAIHEAERNDRWHLWSWSPVRGYECVAHWHSSRGGRGPDGVINDFVFLPDGRLVVGGEFMRLDNPGGVRYRGVNALAVYDPKEPTANRWKPLGTVQYNGTVSSGGSIMSLAYDPQANDLYVGGSFEGIRGGSSSKIHRYDFDANDWVPLAPGVNGAKPIIHRLFVDPSTKPSTLYVGGKFHYTAGDGKDPEAGGTSRYSTGFASWQEGTGWRTYPSASPADVMKHRESYMLQRAADYAHFDAVQVLDFLVDGADIWIVGAFSEGATSDKPLRGLAKWDAAKQAWVDPTGKGGFGRECHAVAKGADGKLYFSGAFGGRKGATEFYEGFKNGDPAHMACSFDPKTGTWAELGTGLSSAVMPECRLAVAGNDVFFVGDFRHFGNANFGPKADKAFESAYVARWNETVDFTTGEAPLPEGAAEPYDLKEPLDEKPWSTGNEHWSRRFVAPPRQKAGKTQMTGATGMDDGTGAPTQITQMVWLGDTLYFSGSWEVQMNERWYVWSYHAERGWTGLAYEKKGGVRVGPDSPPKGLKVHDGKLWAHGPIASCHGISVLDPASGQWSPFKGTYRGAAVEGNAVEPSGGSVNDLAWDSKTGDMYIVGSCGIADPDAPHPKDVAQLIRVDKTGEYHTMGHMLKAEDPNKPVLSIECIWLDERKEPTDVYLGGTFCFYGPVPTEHKRMCFNVARWSHQDKDWRPFGKGVTRGMSPLDQPYYPEGLPGLPARPGDFSGFLMEGFPRVRCLAMDKAGNLYAGGALAVLDDRLPVKDRQETVGLAKYDPAADRWVGCTTVGGLNRDVDQMTFLDDTTMLLSGSFTFDNAWGILNNVALLDVTTGQLSPLGGGLQRAVVDQTIGACVVHAVNDQGYWFGGFFDHAGVNANSRVEAPVPSAYVAHWNPKESLDPNAGLVVKPVAPLPPVTGPSTKSCPVTLEVEGVTAGCTVSWYDRSTTGDFQKKATGPSFKTSVRVKEGMTSEVFYVTVTRADGTEGGKLPVRIPIGPAQ